jgi:hypothetical protein
MNQYLSKDEYLELVKQDIQKFNFVPHQIRYNKEFVLEVIDTLTSEYGKFLTFLSPNLRKNADIWIKMMKKDPFTLRFAPRSIKSNKSVAMAAIVNCKDSGFRRKGETKQDEYLLDYVEDPLRSDEDVAVEAYKIDPFSDWYFSSVDIKLAMLKKEYEKELPVNDTQTKRLKI